MEGGLEHTQKKNCKQMETLRILGERSREHSADTWILLFLSVAYGTFYEAEQRKQRKNMSREKVSMSKIQYELFCNGWILHKLFFIIIIFY